MKKKSGCRRDAEVASFNIDKASDHLKYHVEWFSIM